MSQHQQRIKELQDQIAKLRADIRQAKAKGEDTDDLNGLLAILVSDLNFFTTQYIPGWLSRLKIIGGQNEKNNCIG